MFIALTGGIGCGKSAALAAFGECGLITADADKICHEFYTLPEGISLIQSRWPSVITAEGTVDRKKLGNIVFRDENDLAVLENMIKPYLEEKLHNFRCSGSVTVVEIPLLFEKELNILCDRTIAVWSPFALRRARLAARNWDHAECSRRERLQWSPEQKLAAADFGIINTGSMDLLRQQCCIIAEKLKQINSDR